MREVISFSIPFEIRDNLNRAASRIGVNRSVVIREALKDYLFRQRFRQLREETLLEVEAKNKRTFTDEDVFKIVS